MTATRYTTLVTPGTSDLEIKRSRFLCLVAPVVDERQARGVVEEARREHWDARHHCSAFILGTDGRLERSSDDGEPAGTAGAPMLAVLRGSGLTNVAAVVTRWFGGTLLGAGGLARAYAESVSLALDGAPRLERRLLDVVTLRVGHAFSGRLESELRRRSYVVDGVSYADSATFTVGVDAARRPELDAVVAEITAGTGETAEAGTRWVDVSG